MTSNGHHPSVKWQGLIYFRNNSPNGIPNPLGCSPTCEPTATRSLYLQCAVTPKHTIKSSECSEVHWLCSGSVLPQCFLQWGLVAWPRHRVGAFFLKVETGEARGKPINWHVQANKHTGVKLLWKRHQWPRWHWCRAMVAHALRSYITGKLLSHNTTAAMAD